MNTPEAFVIERTYHAPVQKVWKALTDKNDMKQWYFDIAEFKPVKGFAFSFEGQNDGRVYIHHCVIEEVIVNRMLKYSWSYEGYTGNSFVTFELFEQGDKTRLKLTHEGLETFPLLPDFARHNFEKGWTYITGKSLPEFLEK